LSHSDRNPSEIAESHRNCGKVQDAYTLRCVPQVKNVFNLTFFKVHGVVHDTLYFARQILETEINSATDNPLIFADKEEIISG
jgi:histidine ammonia-lyase